MVFEPQQNGHLAHPVKRMRCVFLVQQPHVKQIFWRLALRLIIVAGPRHPQKVALALHGDILMLGIDP
jgi:hypothetical protein